MGNEYPDRADIVRVIENEIREAKQDRLSRSGTPIGDHELAKLIVCALEEHKMIVRTGS